MMSENAEGIGSVFWEPSTGNSFDSGGISEQDGARAALLTARLEQHADRFVAHIGRCAVCLSWGQRLCREGEYMADDAATMRWQIAMADFDRRPRRRSRGPNRSATGLPGFFTVIDPSRAVEPNAAG